MSIKKTKQEKTIHLPCQQKKSLPNKTTVIINYDAGFPNQLYIRGQGASLSWDKGIPLQNVKANEWKWETAHSFNSCEFKILLNDQQYENGENHSLHAGRSLSYTPHFS